ncbi:hypothetical protein BGLA2_1150004 [Burkholderia gladioli]|nr:hypothetical protein BGLA2_1150004 [Burkholderia gladioli]
MTGTEGDRIHATGIGSRRHAGRHGATLARLAHRVHSGDQPLFHVGALIWPARRAEQAFPGRAARQQGAIGPAAGRLFRGLFRDGDPGRAADGALRLQARHPARAHALRDRRAAVHPGLGRGQLPVLPVRAVRDRLRPRLPGNRRESLRDRTRHARDGRAAPEPVAILQRPGQLPRAAGRRRLLLPLGRGQPGRRRGARLGAHHLRGDRRRGSAARAADRAHADARHPPPGLGRAACRRRVDLVASALRRRHRRAVLLRGSTGGRGRLLHQLRDRALARAERAARLLHAVDRAAAVHGRALREHRRDGQGLAGPAADALRARQHRALRHRAGRHPGAVGARADRRVLLHVDHVPDHLRARRQGSRPADQARRLVPGDVDRRRGDHALRDGARRRRLGREHRLRAAARLFRRGGLVRLARQPHRLSHDPVARGPLAGARQACARAGRKARASADRRIRIRIAVWFACAARGAAAANAHDPDATRQRTYADPTYPESPSLPANRRSIARDDRIRQLPTRQLPAARARAGRAVRRVAHLGARGPDRAGGGRAGFRACR